MKIVQAQEEVTQYFVDVITTRRAMAPAERPPGLVTDALDWRIDGEPVSDQDLLMFYLLMFMAGLDTVTAELGYGFLHLATHPADRQRLVDDPGIIPTATEELLRAYPIVNTPREVTRETEVAGCPVRPGDFVMISFPSAGRDDAAHADARTVDFDRPNLSHLTFGAGPHRCLGSHLARHKLTIAYEEWHRRIPDYRIDERAAVEEASGGMMTLNSLPLVWEA
jgi:cytochrome P450